MIRNQTTNPLMQLLSSTGPAKRAGWQGRVQTNDRLEQKHGKLWVWAMRMRTRAALGRLSDRELSDIGVSRATAAEEAGKPFWVR